MLSVRVLYFAVLRDLVGLSDEIIEIDSDCPCVADVFTILENRHESIRGKLGKVRAAKNQKFASPQDPLVQDDEIALIPPVAGG